jgi:hypothetical protein
MSVNAMVMRNSLAPPMNVDQGMLSKLLYEVEGLGYAVTIPGDTFYVAPPRKRLRHAIATPARLPFAIALTAASLILSVSLTACGQKHEATQPVAGSAPSAITHTSAPAVPVVTQGGSAPAVQAQSALQRGGEPELDCEPPFHDEVGKKDLWDGHAISISVDGNPDDPDASCDAKIYDKFGKVVYQAEGHTGPGFILDPSTGMDIGADGSPDVVLLNGAPAADNPGDWEIQVISLRPQPHLVFTFGQNSPSAGFARDSQGRIALWTGYDWFAALQNSYGIPNAERPHVERVYRFTDGKLTDVTPDYCVEIEHRLFMPSAHEIADFKVNDISAGNFDYSEAADMLNVILQEIFCRRFDQALAFIHRAWPDQDRPNLIKGLHDESKSWNCPECEQAIAAWH